MSKDRDHRAWRRQGIFSEKGRISVAPCKFTSPRTLQTVCQFGGAVILPYQIGCLVQQALLRAALFRVTSARQHPSFAGCSKASREVRVGSANP